MANHSRSRAVQLLTLSAISSFSLATFGQSATPAPSVADAADHDAFCRDHWLAVTRCHDRPWSGPALVFGADIGVSKMNESGPFGFDTGVGTVTHAGPAWGVRVGVDLFPWLTLEARYVGMYGPVQSSVSPAGSVGFLATGGEAVARLTAPLPYVRPYIFGGVAYYDVALVGSSEAKAASVLFSSSQPGIPLGFGFEVPLTWHLSVGAEATYHFMLGESYSNVTTNGIDGGDISTFNAVVRARL
jgi:Outer membrane protein beta-barrel domain